MHGLADRHFAASVLSPRRPHKQRADISTTRRAADLVMATGRTNDDDLRLAVGRSHSPQVIYIYPGHVQITSGFFFPGPSRDVIRLDWKGESIRFAALLTGHVYFRP